MNYEARTVIQNELDANERLIWADVPKQGFLLKTSDWFMIPFSLFWTGFSVFWVLMALQIPRDGEVGFMGYLFPLFGVPFILVGVYLIFGRFFVDIKKRKHTFYGLTRERAIIVTGSSTKKTQSVSLKALKNVSLTEKSDGSGTVSLGKEVHELVEDDDFNDFDEHSSSTRRRTILPPRFELIDNARHVYKQIREYSQETDE